MKKNYMIPVVENIVLTTAVLQDPIQVASAPIDVPTWGD